MVNSVLETHFSWLINTKLLFFINHTRLMRTGAHENSELDVIHSMNKRLSPYKSLACYHRTILGFMVIESCPVAVLENEFTYLYFVESMSCQLVCSELPALLG